MEHGLCELVGKDRVGRFGLMVGTRLDCGWRLRLGWRGLVRGFRSPTVRGMLSRMPARRGGATLGHWDEASVDGAITPRLRVWVWLLCLTAELLIGSVLEVELVE